MRQALLSMPRGTGLVILVFVALGGVAEGAGPPMPRRQAPQTRRRANFALRDIGDLRGPLPGFMPLRYQKTMRFVDGQILFMTDEEYRQFELKRKAEKEALERGAQQWEAMRRENARRAEEKLTTYGIGFAIVAVVLVVRFLVWLGGAEEKKKA